MPQIPFLVEYHTDFDSGVGGSAVVYAEDEGEALLKSEDYCHDKICDEIEEVYEEDKFSVDITITEFNHLEGGDIRDYDVID